MALLAGKLTYFSLPKFMATGIGNAKKSILHCAFSGLYFAAKAAIYNNQSFLQSNFPLFPQGSNNFTGNVVVLSAQRKLIGDELFLRAFGVGGSMPFEMTRRGYAKGRKCPNYTYQHIVSHRSDKPKVRAVKWLAFSFNPMYSNIDNYLSPPRNQYIESALGSQTTATEISNLIKSDLLKIDLDNKRKLCAKKVRPKVDTEKTPIPNPKTEIEQIQKGARPPKAIKTPVRVALEQLAMKKDSKK